MNEDERSNNQTEHQVEQDTGVATATRPKTQTPAFYRVVILNDDFTPQQYVIHILQKFFLKGIEEATRLMTEVHRAGSGVAGTYPFEVAETKAYQVNDYSKQNNYPLKCTVERA